MNLLKEVIADHLPGICLKPQQEEVLRLLHDRKSVFGSMPTGWGKSMTFGLLPLLEEKINPSQRYACLIVSPLNSIMDNQIETWTKRSVRCAQLKRTFEYKDNTAFEAAKSCVRKAHLIFTSPEALQDDGWWDFLRHMNQANIGALVVDESHCLLDWGVGFRPAFRKVPHVLSILPPSTPVLALTGTPSRRMFEDVQDMFDVVFYIVSKVPDRPNIELQIKGCDRDVYTGMKCYIDHLLERLSQAERCIIYCRSINHTSYVYSRLVLKLRKKLYLDPATPSAKTTIVEQYHSKLTQSTKDRILHRLLVKDSTLRCVVATIALGMGVDLPDVRRVLMWGPPSTVNTYWQETGRAGRDGEPAKCIMLVYTGSCNVKNQFVSEDMKAIVDDALKKTGCIRSSVLDKLKISTTEMQGWERPTERCCSVCNPPSTEQSENTDT